MSDNQFPASSKSAVQRARAKAEQLLISRYGSVEAAKAAIKQQSDDYLQWVAKKRIAEWAKQRRETETASLGAAELINHEPPVGLAYGIVQTADDNRSHSNLGNGCRWVRPKRGMG